MTAASAINTAFGKSTRGRGETSRAVVNAIKQMYAAPAVILGRWLRITDKQAKRKLNCERRLSDDELGALIRSERGFEIVAAIMGDASPEWWRLCSALMDAADIRKMQIAAQKRIAKTLKGALDADADLSAAIARSEALAFQDPEHMRPHLDALRSIARVPDRAVAARKADDRA